MSVETLKMRTKVVHNRLYFDHPHVTVVDADAFFLVFSRDGRWSFDASCYRVEADWSPPSDDTDAEEFAVRCTTLDGGAQWKLDVVCGDDGHPLSAAFLNGQPWRRGLLHCCAREQRRRSQTLRGDRGKKTDFSPFRNSNAVVSSGDCIELIMEIGYKQGFQFSLFEVEDEETEAAVQPESENPEELAPRPKLPRLIDLPEVVLHEIVRHLPAKDVRDTLPLVCPRLHEAAWKRTSWPVLKFTTKLESHYDDYFHLLERGRDRCEALSVEDSFIWREEDPNYPDNPLLAEIFMRSWKEVKALELLGAVDDDISGWLGHAAQNGVFPKLEKLTVVATGLRRAVACLLDGCDFPTLKDLTIKAGDGRFEHFFLAHGCVYLAEDARHSRPSDDNRIDAEAFFRQFPNLERLTLTDEGSDSFVDRGTWDDLFVRAFASAGCLTKLKELRLRVSSEVFNPDTLPPFSMPGVEVLLLFLRTPVPSLEPAPLRVKQLLRRFPNLKRLGIGRESGGVLWSGVRRRRLRGLELLAAATPWLGLRPRLMRNLRAVAVDADDLETDRRLVDLLTLPRLAAVRLGGVGSLRRLAEHLPPTVECRNVTFLKLTEGFDLNGATWPPLERVLADSFPVLERLGLTVSSLSLPGRLLRRFADVAARLTSLELVRADAAGPTDWFPLAVGELAAALRPRFRSCVRDSGCAWFWKSGTLEPWNFDPAPPSIRQFRDVVVDREAFVSAYTF